ncbi:hypothetical protein OUZ56_016830 [Daphnia magna]|uniref:Uncharacterized protein n=1 Tax=Daphnia magna TaxID=35525 RepID=A0ABR0ARQ4_9CRUS|nr:hypothetical protein OUZ56_016830 [Daphnia magna]
MGVDDDEPRQIVVMGRPPTRNKPSGSINGESLRSGESRPIWLPLANALISLAYADFWAIFMQQSRPARNNDGVNSSPGAAFNPATDRLRAESVVLDSIILPIVGGGRLEAPASVATTAFTLTSSHTATGLTISRASGCTAPPPNLCGYSSSPISRKAGPARLWWPSVSSLASIPRLRSSAGFSSEGT